MKNRYLQIIFISILIFMLLGLSFISFIKSICNNSPQEMILYKNEQYKIEFNYPGNWYLSLLPNGNHGDKDIFLIISYITQSPYIEISSRIFDNPTYSDIVCWGVSKTTQNRRVFSITDPKNICSKNLSIDIEKYEYYDLRDNIFGRKGFRCVDYFKLSDQTGYKFTFCSKDNEWESLNKVFTEIYNSIKIEY